MTLQPRWVVRLRLVAILLAAFGIALAAGCGGGGGGSASAPTATAQSAALPPFNFEIRTLSNRADLISDGDALVEVQVPNTVPMDMVTLTLNGADVRAAFVADEQARTLRGVLTGLVDGANVFAADANGQGNGRPRANLTITKHVRGARRRAVHASRSTGRMAQRPTDTWVIFRQGRANSVLGFDRLAPQRRAAHSALRADTMFLGRQ